VQEEELKSSQSKNTLCMGTVQGTGSSAGVTELPSL